MHKRFEFNERDSGKSKQGNRHELTCIISPWPHILLNSCPAELRGCSDQGQVWRFQVPIHLQFQATNNLLEYLTAIITPWIDLLTGRLERGDCALLMTNSTTAKGWMQKSKFSKVGKAPLQATVCADAACHHACLFMDAKIKGYSQWFAGNLNNVADALSWDWHQDDKELTKILRLHFPQQMPMHFKISPLPNEINSWLILLLQCLPVNKWLREKHMTTNLAHGLDGKSSASQSDVETSSWTVSESKSKSSYLEHLPWLSGVGDSLICNSTHQLKVQSEVPYQLWCRSSGNWEDRIPLKMQITSLASFYCNSSGPSGMKTLRRNNKRPFLSQSLMN